MQALIGVLIFLEVSLVVFLIGYYLGASSKRSARLQILDSKGKPIMPLTLSVGKTATAVLTEFDAAGAVVPAVTPPTYTSDNPAVATVSGNQVTAVAIGTANISGADSGDGISASDVLTVVDVATTGKLSLSAN